MEFKEYKRKGLSEMTPYTEDMNTTGISISKEDIENGSPKIGDMIARNPKNHKDMWLVAKQYFNENLEPAFDIKSKLDDKLYTRTYKSGWDVVTDKVSIKEIIEGHKWFINNSSSMVCAYNKSWGSDFSTKETIESVMKMPSQINENIDFTVFSREELYEIGFGNWDGKLITIPLILWGFIPNGTKLTSISGDTTVKNDKFDDLDQRGGNLAYGFIKD